MLREMLRSKQRPHSRTCLVKEFNLNNINILSNASTVPGTIAQYTLGANSVNERIKGSSSNGSPFLKPTNYNKHNTNTNINTNFNTVNNTNINTHPNISNNINTNLNTNNININNNINNSNESNRISSSHSIQAKTNSIQSISNTIFTHIHTHNNQTSNPGFSNPPGFSNNLEDAINNNSNNRITNHNNLNNINENDNHNTQKSTQSQPLPKIIPENTKQSVKKSNDQPTSQSIDKKYEERLGEYLNTTPTQKEASKLNSSKSHSLNKLQTLESFITQIKQNVYDKSKPYLTEKEKMKGYLKTNVDVLSTHIRLVNKEKKVNGHFNKNIVNENDRLISTGERASRDTFFMNKELPLLKVEIDEMKTSIAQYTEEAKYIRNDSIQLERETMLLKDEIKKTNGQISQLLKTNEKLTKAKVLVDKHIEMAKGKIQKQERLSEELLNNVKQLLEQSSHVFDYVKL